MLTTLSIIFLVLSIPFLVTAGRHRIFSAPPNMTTLRRTISVPSITTRKRHVEGRPRNKRRATEGDEMVTSNSSSSQIPRGAVVAEPDEDDAALSDTSTESYVRFGRGMTYVDNKVGGGILRSSVDREDSVGIGSAHHLRRKQ